MDRRSLLGAGAGLGTALALYALPGSTRAQAADKTLKIVVGYAAGGASDRAARIIGEKLQGKLGMTVIVENKTGAGGRLAAQQVKAAGADQNVLLIGNPAVMVVAPLVFKDNGYDPLRDFVAVSHVNTYEFAVAVASAVPVKELSHLLAWLRANPDKANVGVPATGSLPHFFALMLGDKAGVRTEVIGYRGSAPLATDLIGGQLPIVIDTLDSLMPLHDSGKLRVLASSGERRPVYAPSIPTFREAGLDLTASGWGVMFAPASMPSDKVDRYARALREVMSDPDVIRRFVDAKMTPVASTRAQTEQMLKAYRAQWAPVVTKSGYQP